jgi:Zn-dependent protease with chaperone function
MTDHPPPRPDYSILSGFRPVITRPRASVLYQFSLLLVSVTMLLLPLIYLALVGAAAYGVYFHAVHHWSPIMHFGGVGGQAMVLKFLVYLIPLLVGVLVVFFMFKPIFAGQPKGAQPLALNPADNPLLYAFIEKICETVGAPSPKRIDLDCDLNASASFRRGLWSMAGGDLVLTIGLPLVANLSAAEFAGVVAHEFGHFKQSVGMRLCYLIRRVNFWFIRVVYQRDAWDEALEEWSNQARAAWIVLMVWCAQIGVWFARLVLRLLMYIGLLIGGFLIRQMEYDADACQIRLVGSETFERTHRKLATLSAATELMYKKIHATWRKTHQLPDNLSELLRHSHEHLPAPTLQKIEDRYGLERTRLFDSHPSPADRIRRARRAQDPGAFHDDRPASSLFASFEHPARFVTLLHYTDDLGIPVAREMLVRVQTRSDVPNEGGRQTDPVATEVHQSYFLGILPLILPLQLEPPAPSDNYAADFTELAQVSNSLREVADQLKSIGTQYQQATEQLIRSRSAIRLLEARVKIKAGDFGLTAENPENAREHEAEALTTRDSLQHSVREVGTALQRRLQLGLSLKLSEADDLGDGPDTAKQLIHAAAHVQSASVDYRPKKELLEALEVLNRILELRDSEGESPALARALAAQTTTVNSFRSQPAYLPSERPASATLHLQLSRRPRHEGNTDLPPLRQQTQQWFADYHAHLNLLVEAARTIECPNG